MNWYFQEVTEKIKLDYSILKRKLSPNTHKGFSNQDVIYLIMADRFCDGNPNNNTIDDSLDEFTSKDLDGRKGGDIEGIISKLELSQRAWSNLSLGYTDARKQYVDELSWLCCNKSLPNRSPIWF